MRALRTKNEAYTVLAQAMGATDTSCGVADASRLPEAPFLIRIEDEIIQVGGKSGNTLTGLQRGLEGTTSTSHDAGQRVENVWTAGAYQELVDEAIALGNKFSTSGHTHSGQAGDAPLIPWTNISGKPSTFPPSVHKSTHASGGSDPLSPADIGAVQNAGSTPSILANALANRPTPGVSGRLFIATDTNEIYRDTGTAWVLLGGVGPHASTHAYGGGDALPEDSIHGNQLRKGHASTSSSLFLASGAAAILPKGIWMIYGTTNTSVQYYVDGTWQSAGLAKYNSGPHFSDGTYVRLFNGGNYPDTAHYFAVIL